MSKNKEIKNILAEFKEKGISQIQIERIFEIPISTLDKEESSEVLSLLKLIKIFPWMIEVANKNYNETEAKEIMLHNAINVMMEKERENKLK
jgi:predicted transcriptional regulator